MISQNNFFHHDGFVTFQAYGPKLKASFYGYESANKLYDIIIIPEKDNFEVYRINGKIAEKDNKIFKEIKNHFKL